jgi:integrase
LAGARQEAPSTRVEKAGPPVTGGPVVSRPERSTRTPNCRRWKDLPKTAGLRDARLHDARHTAATVLLIIGVPVPVVMSIMGWAGAGMARRYRHVTDPIRQTMAKQVGGLLWEVDEETSDGAEKPSEQAD